jgi:hypothetical protein
VGTTTVCAKQEIVSQMNNDFISVGNSDGSTDYDSSNIIPGALSFEFTGTSNLYITVKTTLSETAVPLVFSAVLSSPMNLVVIKTLVLSNGTNQIAPSTTNNELVEPQYQGLEIKLIKITVQIPANVKIVCLNLRVIACNFAVDKITFSPSSTQQTEGTSSEKTSSEGTSSKGTSSEGTSSEGTSSKGTSSQGTSSQGTSSEGTSSEGTSSKSTSSKGTSSEGTSSEGTSSKGTSSQGTSSECTISMSTISV